MTQLESGGGGSYDEDVHGDVDYERPGEDEDLGLVDEAKQVLDPTQSASDATEVALRSNPLTGGLAFAADVGEVAGGEDVTETTGYQASENTAENVTETVKETTEKVTETVKESVVPDLPDWLPYALGAPIVLGILALLAYAFGQILTVNTEV